MHPRSCSVLAVTVVLIALASPGVAQTAAGANAPRLLEVRSYNLKPGSRDAFHRLVIGTLPMLQRWKIDVVSYGPSRHDNDSYFLMRAFSSIEDRQRLEDAFYGSEEWRTGPREAVLSHIVSYTTVVVAVDEGTLRGLRQTAHAAR